MMRARVNLITADPDRMADTIGYIKTSVRPAVDSMDGSLGLSLYANAEIGVAVLESFWASREALIHSEQMAAPRRTDVVRRAVGTVSVERYRVPVYEREAPLDTAAGLRLTRMDMDPPRIEDTVECFGATVVPRLADAEGSAARCCWSTATPAVRSARPCGSAGRRWRPAAVRRPRSGSRRYSRRAP